MRSAANLQPSQRESAVANRKDLIEESQRAKMTAREISRIEKQRKLAEILREKVDAHENGEDVERKRNWQYSIEEDQEWQKRLEKKTRRADFEFHGRFNSRQKWPSLLNPST
jgi:pre-mRNA-splicing factor SYF2